jgi:hypothetical protein
MKTIIKLVICLLSLTSFAQIAPLENHTWYLEKLVIGGNDFLPPTAYQNSYTTEFLNGSLYYFNSPCSAVYLEGGITHLNNQKFKMNYAYVTLSTCPSLNGVDEYDLLISQTYININSINNNFSYAFTYQPNYIVLTITNGNGDQAIYRNQQLGVSSNEKSEVDLYPNPVTSSFQLDIDAGSNIKTVRIFSVDGKEVMHFKKPQDSYNVSQLSPGIYFVKIESEYVKNNIKLLKI